MNDINEVKDYTKKQLLEFILELNKIPIKNYDNYDFKIQCILQNNKKTVDLELFHNYILHNLTDQFVIFRIRHYNFCDRKYFINYILPLINNKEILLYNIIKPSFIMLTFKEKLTLIPPKLKNDLSLMLFIKILNLNKEDINKYIIPYLSSDGVIQLLKDM